MRRPTSNDGHLTQRPKPSSPFNTFLPSMPHPTSDQALLENSAPGGQLDVTITILRTITSSTANLARYDSSTTSDHIRNIRPVSAVSWAASTKRITIIFDNEDHCSAAFDSGIPGTFPLQRMPSTTKYLATILDRLGTDGSKAKCTPYSDI